MKLFKKNIDNQIAFNKGKNLFHDEAHRSLKLIPETLLAIDKINEIDKESENILVDYVTDKALQEFCRINQYYTFNKQAKKDLREIYVELFSRIKDNGNSLNSISEKHFENLIKWLKKTNSFGEEIYATANDIIEPVACSEYTPELQIEILQIQMKQLLEPVLDIGCGKTGNLVMYFRQNGIEAFGFDRFAFNHPLLFNSDWIEFEFGIEKWGTITSNLGFSNHFTHHHLRNDGNYIEYAKKYMEILNSLKKGGAFHYAPNLPFIEQYLDPLKFKLTVIEIGECNFKSVKIERLI